MNSPRLILGLLLYVCVTSILIAAFAAGMGYTGITTGEGSYNITTPDVSGDSLPVVGTAQDTGEMVGSFLQALGLVLAWTLPGEIFPWWANLIFIKIPLIGLIIAVVEVFLP